MKKILIVIGMIILLTGCGNKNLENIKVNDFYKLVENKETVIVYIGSKTCSACETFSPEFNNALEANNLKAKYIDMNNESEEDKSKFIKEYNITGTPTVIFLKNGYEDSLLSRINGALKQDAITQKLKSNGFIK